ncbi:hypothetical protein M9458_050828, partial [Cirrhinus mrigala]
SDRPETDIYVTSRPAPASGRQAEKAPRDREPPVKFPLNKLHVGCWVRRGHEGDRRGPPNRAREFRGPRRFLGRSGTGTVRSAREPARTRRPGPKKPPLTAKRLVPPGAPETGPGVPQSGTEKATAAQPSRYVAEGRVTQLPVKFEAPRAPGGRAEATDTCNLSHCVGPHSNKLHVGTSCMTRQNKCPRATYLTGPPQAFRGRCVFWQIKPFYELRRTRNRRAAFPKRRTVDAMRYEKL